MVEVRIAVDSTRSEAYVRNISLVPHGTPSASPDVERFGTTLQGFVPTAFLIQQIDPIASVVTTRDHRAEQTFRARGEVERVRSRTQVPPSSSSRTPRIANRRSTRAGVSWPNEDANEASELDVFRQSFVALRAHRLKLQKTMRFARSYEFWRGERRVKRSSRSFGATHRSSTEVSL
jgi:hypothetical protein